MKRLILLLTLLLPYALQGQTKGETIMLKGRVRDYVTHLDLPGSQVELLSAKDSSVVASTIARSKYRSLDQTWETSEYEFSIPKRTGEYLLRISLQGYDTSYRKLSLLSFYKRETRREVPTAYLQRIKTVELEAVTATASRVTFYHRGDTLVYNTSAFQLAEGSMLDALIRKLPGAELRKDGKIYVNGRFVENLMLNGKDFFRGDNKIMLENLPVYTVSDIKVYEHLGDDSRFAGRELGGDKKYAMDVRLKKQYNIGMLANIELGAGTEERYLARLFGMRFSDHSRLAAYGNLNNLNDSRKPGENGSWSPSDLNGGEKTLKKGGLDYNIEKRGGAYKLSGNVQASLANNLLVNETTRTNFLQGGDTHERIHSSKRDRGFNLSTDHRFYWEFKDANLEIKPRLSYSDSKGFNDYASLSLGSSLASRPQLELSALFAPELPDAYKRDAINRNIRGGLSEGRAYSGGLSAQSVIKFKHSPDILTLYASASFSHKDEERYDRNSIGYYQMGALSSTDFRNRYFDIRPESGYSLIGKAAYNYIFKRGLYIKWSYKYEHRLRDSYSSLYRLDQLAGWNEGTIHPIGSLPSVNAYRTLMDATNSYSSRQKDDSHTIEAFLGWSKETEHSKWSGQLVLPFTLLARVYDYERAGHQTHLKKQNLLLNIYSTFLKWKSTDNKYEAQLQYSLAPQTPDMNMYVDLLDTTDPLNIHRGNADIKTGYKHEVIASINRIYPKKRIMLGIEGVGSYIQDAIAMGYSYDRQTGVRTYRPDNVNGNWQAQLALACMAPLNKARTLNMKLITGAGLRNHVDDVTLSGLTTSQRSEVREKNLMQRLQLDYKIGKSSIGLKSDGTWRRMTSERIGFQPTNALELNYGLTANINLPWKLQLSTDATIYSRRGYVDRAMNTDDFVWNARLSRSFLKGRLLVMLDGFDILGGLSSIRRQVNAQGISETYSNVIPRYILLHATYRLHSTPKRK